jgi:hypothetical protein
MLAGLRRALRDPIGRWEARRYWTWRRLTVCGGFLLAWAGGMALWAVLARGIWSPGPQPVEEIMAIVFAFYWLTLPLTFMAGTAGALSIAPERDSGVLEQIVLTPVDPGRFCRARLAGRVKGVLALWLFAGPVLAGCAALVWKGGLVYDSQATELAVAWGALYLICPAMLTVGTAVGMRCSATSPSTAVAVARTYPVVLLIVPAAMLWGVFAISAIVAGCAGGLVTVALQLPGTAVGIAVGGAALTAFPAWFAVVSVRKSLSEAAAAMDKVFYSPGEI